MTRFNARALQLMMDAMAADIDKDGNITCRICDRENECCTCELENAPKESFGPNKTYVCEFCGIYNATKPRCNKCEEER